VALAEAEEATSTPTTATSTPAPSTPPRTTLTPEEKALRGEIAAGRQTLKTLHTQANTLSQENKTLNQQVRTGLKAVKAGTKTPTSTERIAELVQTLDQLRESINATDGQVKQNMQDAHTSIAAKDFAAAKTSVDQAISVLESRIALKQKVNTALKELVTLLG
jgi:flagellar hook-associated protein FlgK